MKILIVYFSRSGHNESLAKKLQKNLKADVETIESLTDYSGFRGFMRGGKQNFFRQKTKIKPIKKDLKAYHLVVLISPVWAGLVPPPVRAFLLENKNYLKKLVFISVCEAGLRNQKTIPEIEKILGHQLAGSQLTTQKEFQQKKIQQQLVKYLKSI